MEPVARWELTEPFHTIQPKTDQPMLTGQFVPEGSSVWLNVGVSGSMKGVSKTNLQLLWSQRRTPPLQNGRVWPRGIYDDATLRNIGNIFGDSQAVAFRRLLLEGLVPGEPVYWELYPSIVGYMDMIEVDLDPVYVRIMPGDKVAYVACAGSVVPVELHNDFADAKHVRRDSVAGVDRPIHLVPSDDGSQLFVADAVGVAMIDTATHDFTRLATVDGGCSSVAVLADGILAADPGGSRLVRIGPDGSSHGDIGCDFTPGHVIASGEHVFVSSPQGVVAEIGVTAGAVTRQVEVGDGAAELALHPTAPRLWVAVSTEGVCRRIDLSSFAVDMQSESIPKVKSLAIDADGLSVFCSTDQPADEVPHFSYFTEADGKIFDQVRMQTTVGNIALTQDSYIYLIKTGTNQLNWWHGGTFRCRPEDPFWCEYAEVTVEGATAI